MRAATNLFRILTLALICALASILPLVAQTQMDRITVTSAVGAITDKGGQVANVKAYGAKGDGLTDDTVAIQAAVNALVPASGCTGIAATNQCGGKVLLPAGTYITSSAVTLPSAAPIWFAGISNKTSVLKCSASDACIKADFGALDVGATDTTRLHISDLMILPSGVAADAIYFQNVHNWIIERTFVSGTGPSAAAAYQLSGVYDGVLRDNYVQGGFGQGAYITDGNNNGVAHASGSNAIVISGNHFLNCSSQGLLINGATATSAGLDIHGNSFEGNTLEGLDLRTVFGVQIVGNYIGPNGSGSTNKTGIEVCRAAVSSRCKGISITSNEFVGKSGNTSLIHLDQASDVHIAANHYNTAGEAAPEAEVVQFTALATQISAGPHRIDSGEPQVYFAGPGSASGFASGGYGILSCIFFGTLADCVNATSGNSLIYIPAGTRTDTLSSLPDGTHVIGAGLGKTIIAPASGTVPLNFGTCTGCTVENLTLSSTAADAMTFSTSTDCTLINVETKTTTSGYNVNLGASASAKGLGVTFAAITTGRLAGSSTGLQWSGYTQAAGTLTFGSIAAQTCSEQNLTLTGAAAQAVWASPLSSIGSGFSWSAWVSAANTVTVRVCNVTAGALTPNAVTWNVQVPFF